MRKTLVLRSSLRLRATLAAALTTIVILTTTTTSSTTTLPAVDAFVIMTIPPSTTTSCLARNRLLLGAASFSSPVEPSSSSSSTSTTITDVQAAAPAAEGEATATAEETVTPQEETVTQAKGEALSQQQQQEPAVLTTIQQGNGQPEPAVFDASQWQPSMAAFKTEDRFMSPTMINPRGNRRGAATAPPLSQTNAQRPALMLMDAVDQFFSPAMLNPDNRPVQGLYSDEGVGYEKGGSGNGASHRWMNTLPTSSAAAAPATAAATAAGASTTPRMTTTPPPPPPEAPQQRPLPEHPAVDDDEEKVNPKQMLPTATDATRATTRTAEATATTSMAATTATKSATHSQFVPSPMMDSVDQFFSPGMLNPKNRPVQGLYSDEGVGYEKGGAGSGVSHRPGHVLPEPPAVTIGTQAAATATTSRTTTTTATTSLVLAPHSIAWNNMDAQRQFLANRMAQAQTLPEPLVADATGSTTTTTATTADANTSSISDDHETLYKLEAQRQTLLTRLQQHAQQSLADKANNRE